MKYLKSVLVKFLDVLVFPTRPIPLWFVMKFHISHHLGLLLDGFISFISNSCADNISTEIHF